MNVLYNKTGVNAPEVGEWRHPSRWWLASFDISDVILSVSITGAATIVIEGADTPVAAPVTLATVSAGGSFSVPFRKFLRVNVTAAAGATVTVTGGAIFDSLILTQYGIPFAALAGLVLQWVASARSALVTASGSVAPLLRFFDGPREFATPRYTGTAGASFTHYAGEDYSRRLTPTAQAYDRNGALQDRVVLEPQTISRWPCTLDVEVPEVATGSTPVTITFDRGDGAVGKFVWLLHIDGERVYGPDYVGVDVAGPVTRTINIDSTKFSNGPHTLHFYGHPAEPDPVGSAGDRWRAAADVDVLFQNGSSPMAVIPNVAQVVRYGADVVPITAEILRCDGTRVAPAGPVVLSTSDAAVAAVSGTDVSLVGEGWATITVTADGLSETVRVARYPATVQGLPHVKRNWTVDRTGTYDPAESRWPLAVFWMEPNEVRQDALLRRLLKESRLSMEAGISSNIGTQTLAEAIAAFDTAYAPIWNFLGEEPDLDLVLIGDSLCRGRELMSRTLSNADSAAFLAHVQSEWRTRAKGYFVSLMDENVGGYEYDPKPTDGRWSHAWVSATVTAVTSGGQITVDTDASAATTGIPYAGTVNGRDQRPRLFILSGAHGPIGNSYHFARVDAGAADGSLTLSAGSGFDPATQTLAVGDTVRLAGWYSDPLFGIPDTAITDFVAMLRSGAQDVPLAWSPAAGSQGAAAAWNQPDVADVADVYSSSPSGDDFYVIPDGYYGPQWRKGRDEDVVVVQNTVAADQPRTGLIPWMGYFYTKMDSDQTTHLEFDPDIDVMHAGRGRVEATVLSAALAMWEGMYGGRVYAFDGEKQVNDRKMETYPRTLMGEPLQTGSHPFRKGSGTDKWWGLAAFKRTIDQFNARVFGRMLDAPSFAPEVRVGYRAQGQDRLLQYVNTREREAAGTFSLGSRWHAGGSATRWRQQGMMTWTERISADNAAVTLAPTEVSFLELHQATDAARPCAKWITPAVPAQLETAIEVEINVDPAVQITSAQLFIDGRSFGPLANAGNGRWARTFDGAAWAMSYANDPRREVWVPMHVVLTASNGSTAEIRNAFILPPGEVAPPPPPAVPEDALLDLSINQGVVVNGSNQLTYWLNEGTSGLESPDYIGPVPPVLQDAPDGAAELLFTGGATTDSRVRMAITRFISEVYIVARRSTGGNFSADAPVLFSTSALVEMIRGVAGTTTLSVAAGWSLEIDGVATNVMDDDAYHIIRAYRTDGVAVETLNTGIGHQHNNGRNWPGGVRHWVEMGRLLTDEERNRLMAELLTFRDGTF